MNEFNENNNQSSPIEPQVITPDIPQPQTVWTESQQIQYEPYQNIQPPNESKGMAIASMVLGIVSVAICCMWYIAPFCAIVGLILGIISLNKKQAGRGMALTGVILSGVGLLIGIIMVVLAIIGMANSSNITNDIWRDFDFSDFYDM